MIVPDLVQPLWPILLFELSLGLASNDLQSPQSPAWVHHRHCNRAVPGGCEADTNCRHLLALQVLRRALWQIFRPGQLCRFGSASCFGGALSLSLLHRLLMTGRHRRSLLGGDRALFAVERNLAAVILSAPPDAKRSGDIERRVSILVGEFDVAKPVPAALFLVPANFPAAHVRAAVYVLRPDGVHVEPESSHLQNDTVEVLVDHPGTPTSPAVVTVRTPRPSPTPRPLAPVFDLAGEDPNSRACCCVAR